MDEKVVVKLQDAGIYHSENPSVTLTPKTRTKAGEKILENLNLEIKNGEVVYLIGRVGSGKSPLLKTLYAELPLLEGKGEIAGVDLRSLRRRDVHLLRRKIGIVFQDYRLLHDRNVYENLRFVMKATGWKRDADIDERIGEVLDLVGLHNKEYKMPHELSGGEQQRLVIARAMINSPKIILADEPTGNLDPKAADQIMALFRTIVEGGCSVVMSTHNIANIEQFPGRTYRFHKGKVAEVDINAVLAS